VSEPLSFVTWRWTPPAGYRSKFSAETVNVLKRMVDRHYTLPHRFICVTDDANGINPSVEIVPDWKDFTQIQNPSGSKNPSCYRRLRMFHPDIAQTFGPRFVSMDLDMVITGNLELLLNRADDFVIFADTNPRTFYNGSFVLMTAGARPQVWDTFNPAESPKAARAAGHFGSDQGWVSHCLGPKEKKFTKADGVYSFQNQLKSIKKLPDDARVVVFHGYVDPWRPEVARKYPWVGKHYH